MIRRKIPVALLVVFFLAPAIFAPTLAQRRGGTVTDSAAARREANMSRENDVRNSELNFRRLANDSKARPRSAREQKLTIKQILEDFQRIQLGGNQLRLSATQSNVDYRQISDVAGEIHKRAKRLKANLLIPDSEADTKLVSVTAEGGSQQMKASLPVLSDLIKSFVTNPLFYNLKVTDVHHLERAKQDLASVIQLSDEVKKAARKLK